MRVEFITLGVGPLNSGESVETIRAVVGAATKLSVTSSATAAGSRPEAPAGSTHALFARVSAIDGNAIVAWGADPTAAQNNGVLLMAGQVELFPLRGGEKLSFVELT